MFLEGCLFTICSGGSWREEVRGVEEPWMNIFSSSDVDEVPAANKSESNVGFVVSDDKTDCDLENFVYFCIKSKRLVGKSGEYKKNCHSICC